MSEEDGMIEVLEVCTHSADSYITQRYADKYTWKYNLWQSQEFIVEPISHDNLPKYKFPTLEEAMRYVAGHAGCGTFQIRPQTVFRFSYAGHQQPEFALHG